MSDYLEEAKESAAQCNREQAKMYAFVSMAEDLRRIADHLTQETDH